MLITFVGTVTDISPAQPENAAYPMLVTLEGIVTDVSPAQLENARSPTLVTGQPPRIEGMAIAPDDDFGTAVSLVDPPPMIARPPLIL